MAVSPGARLIYAFLIFYIRYAIDLHSKTVSSAHYGAESEAPSSRFGPPGTVLGATKYLPL